MKNRFVCTNMSVSALLVRISMLLMGILVVKGICVEPMNDSDFISEEKPTKPLSVKDIGFAAMKIPSKSYFWDSWELHIEKPKGKRIKISKEEQTQIAEEIVTYLDNGIDMKKLTNHIKAYSGWIPEDTKKGLRESKIHIDEPGGIVYFTGIRLNGIHITIAGEKGSYLTFFFTIKENDVDSVLQKTRELFPAISIDSLEKKENVRYNEHICRIHRVSQGIQLRAGMRKTNKGKLMAVRLDLDLYKRK